MEESFYKYCFWCIFKKSFPLTYSFNLYTMNCNHFCTKNEFSEKEVIKKKLIVLHILLFLANTALLIHLLPELLKEKRMFETKISILYLILCFTLILMVFLGFKSFFLIKFIKGVNALGKYYFKSYQLKIISNRNALNFMKNITSVKYVLVTLTGFLISLFTLEIIMFPDINLMYRYINLAINFYIITIFSNLDILIAFLTHIKKKHCDFIVTSLKLHLEENIEETKVNMQRTNMNLLTRNNITWLAKMNFTFNYSYLINIKLFLKFSSFFITGGFAICVILYIFWGSMIIDVLFYGDDMSLRDLKEYLVIMLVLLIGFLKVMAMLPSIGALTSEVRKIFMLLYQKGGS